MGQIVTNSFQIRFDTQSASNGNRLAASLSDALQQIPDISIERLKNNEHSQDVGTIISIILGAKSVELAVNAISAWLIKSNQASVTIEKDDRKITIRNMNSSDIPNAIEALRE